MPVNIWSFYNIIQTLLFIFVAQKFATEVVQPLVREMDDKSQLDPSVIQGLFDQGVSLLILTHYFYAYQYLNLDIIQIVFVVLISTIIGS